MLKMEDNHIFVFLSHSHLDYEKVRVVRDLLEKEGFRPLMFFLKCLEKKGYEELTKRLIKEEIDNRQRFVLCDSRNAKESDWVQFEVKHIKESKRPYEIVDLDWPKDRIEDAIKRFKFRSTVFLSYSHEQHNLAEAVNEKLIKLDFRTFFDGTGLWKHEDYAEMIYDNISETVKEGYLLAFIDDTFDTNRWHYHEIRAAMNLGGEIIPVVSSPMPELARFLFYKKPYIDVQNMPIPEAAELIVERLLEIDRNIYQKRWSGD